jgi:hypothetical protein
MRNFIVCTLHQTLLGCTRRKDRQGMLHTREIRNAYEILLRKPVGRDHFGALGVNGRIMLKKQGG